METLTLAQLRQNPSAALRAVEHEGAEFTITNHGRAVARLTPVGHSAWVSAESRAALTSATPNLGWLEEWNAERDRDRLPDDPEVGR